MTKNDTRISSLLGTWTSTMHVKAIIGNYQLLTYFVVHLMPDPMREYSCSLSNCRELDNQVCIKQDKGNHAASRCVNMTEHVVEWSDVSAFIYFGARVDAGIPFNVHKEHNTGGWVGPYSLILAQNYSSHQDNNSAVVDRYVARYVQSPTTPSLHMHPNNTLLSENDFNQYLGYLAVNETVQAQARVVTGDPYEAYLKTCDNGNVKPILPLFDFSFLKDKSTGKESIEVKLDYKVLTIPKKTDIMYKVFPWMQPRVNKRHRGFHISGPYCYGDDPKRGYTFDLNYDSAHESPYMSLIHGCAQGLPCLPSPARLSVEGAADRIIHNATRMDTLEIGSEVFLWFTIYVLLLALLVSATCNCRMSRRQRRRNDDVGNRRPRGRVGGAPPVTPEPGPFGDLAQEGEEQGDLAQPLLADGEEDQEAEQEPARVEFV